MEESLFENLTSEETEKKETEIQKKKNKKNGNYKIEKNNYLFEDMINSFEEDFMDKNNELEEISVWENEYIDNEKEGDVSLLNLFLRQTGKIPILTQEQEQEIMRKIEQYLQQFLTIAYKLGIYQKHLMAEINNILEKKGNILYYSIFHIPTMTKTTTKELNKYRSKIKQIKRILEEYYKIIHELQVQWGKTKNKEKRKEISNQYVTAGIQVMNKIQKYICSTNLEKQTWQYVQNLEKDLLSLKRTDPNTLEYIQKIEKKFCLPLEDILEMSKELLKQYKMITELREYVVKANMRLVVKIAKGLCPVGTELIDLVQEGCLGLMKAVEKFDINKGFRFSTYATWWIRQNIIRTINEHKSGLRMPVHITDQICIMTKTEKQLYQKLHRKPTIEEISNATGFSIKKIQELRKCQQTVVALEQPFETTEPDQGNYLDVLADPKTNSPEQQTIHTVIRDNIKEALSILKSKERQIIILRFGLEDGICYTLEEVGYTLNLTRERVRQIEAKALKKLRSPKIIKKLLSPSEIEG